MVAVVVRMQHNMTMRQKLFQVLEVCTCCLCSNSKRWYTLPRELVWRALGVRGGGPSSQDASVVSFWCFSDIRIMLLHLKTIVAKVKTHMYKCLAKMIRPYITMLFFSQKLSSCHQGVVVCLFFVCVRYQPIQTWSSPLVGLFFQHQQLFISHPSVKNIIHQVIHHTQSTP